MSLIQQQFEEALKAYVNEQEYYDFYTVKHFDNTYHHEFINMAFAMYKAGSIPMKPYNEPSRKLREVG